MEKFTFIWDTFRKNVQIKLNFLEMLLRSYFRRKWSIFATHWLNYFFSKEGQDFSVKSFFYRRFSQIQNKYPISKTGPPFFMSNLNIKIKFHNIPWVLQVYSMESNFLCAILPKVYHLISYSNEYSFLMHNF